MNDDTISRQAAIDALKEHRALYCDNTPDTFSKLSYAEKSRVDELDTAIATLVNLPSAERHEQITSEMDEIFRIASEIRLAVGCNTARECWELARKGDIRRVRHGRWVEEERPTCYIYRCTVCGEGFDTPYHYCPNCGARMDLSEVDE